MSISLETPAHHFASIKMSPRSHVISPSDGSKIEFLGLIGLSDNLAAYCRSLYRILICKAYLHDVLSEISTSYPTVPERVFQIGSSGGGIVVKGSEQAVHD